MCLVLAANLISNFRQKKQDTHPIWNWLEKKGAGLSMLMILFLSVSGNMAVRQAMPTNFGMVCTSPTSLNGFLVRK